MLVTHRSAVGNSRPGLLIATELTPAMQGFRPRGTAMSNIP
jgi:hypothetical protein